MDLILFWIGTRIESVLLLPSTGSTIKSRRIGGAACSCVIAGGVQVSASIVQSKDNGKLQLIL